MPLKELNNVRVVKIGRENIAQAQSLLCDAYEDNEFTRYMFNADKRGYKQRLRGFIHEELLLHFSLSNISVALVLEERLVGVAMVSRADLPLSMATNWRWRMGMYSVAGVRYTERLRRYYKAVQESLKDKKHYWISLMGLHHDFQHHGFGHTLVEAIHQECACAMFSQPAHHWHHPGHQQHYHRLQCSFPHFVSGRQYWNAY